MEGKKRSGGRWMEVEICLKVRKYGKRRRRRRRKRKRRKKR